MESVITLAPNLVSALLSWYDANKRDLPWRDHPDPYAVLVSEFMLQQTTVPAVLPYFEKWMVKYPTLADLAGADPDHVLRNWEGLGYYSRARNLHTAARDIIRQYGGSVPGDPVKLRKLPGIGDYTAAAVASIAFGARTPALDANNYRVLSRLLATSDKKRITRTATRIIPPGRPGDFNQALMDLGTSVCTPKGLLCPDCPLSPWCRAYLRNEIHLHPKTPKTNSITSFEAAIGIIIEDGKVLVQKRPESGLLAGLWEFPGGKLNRAKGAGRGTQERNETARPGAPTTNSGQAERKGEKEFSETPEEAVVREVREETGLRVKVQEKLGIFSHSYTRFRVKLHVFLCKRNAGRVTNPEARWVTLEELERLAMPSANRRIVKKLEEHINSEDAEGRRERQR